MQSLYASLSDLNYVRARRLAYRLANRRKFNRLVRKRELDPARGYSFQPFEQSSSIFIHIPKCAGVSVCKALYGSLAGGHATLTESMYAFEPNQFLSFFKFTVARNPWDRLVSAFHFLKKGGMNERDKEWAERELAEYPDFGSFVRNWLTRENIWKYIHFHPQTYFFRDELGRLEVNYIGYVENLERDFRFISDQVGGCEPLPLSNKSAHSGYMEYYTPELVDLVRHVYQDDVAALGYQFDNANLEVMLRRRDEQFALYSGSKQ